MRHNIPLTVSHLCKKGRGTNACTATVSETMLRWGEGGDREYVGGKNIEEGDITQFGVSI